MHVIVQVFKGLIFRYTDVNECLSEDIHGCSQLCNNTEGSYNCLCGSGFILDPSDNSTCHGIKI